MQRTQITFALVAAIGATAVLVGCATAPSDAEVNAKAAAMLKASFVERGQAKLDRLVQDDTQKTCSEFTGKALTEGGVRLGYVWGNGKYEAAVFGRNITNQIRIVGGIDFNNLTGFINDPRTWGAQFRASF